MLECLQEKLQQDNCSYSEKELIWCLEHIGHPNPDIRDGLIYLSFCKMIEQESLSKKQFQQLGQWCNAEKALFNQIELNGEPTLKRSFTALLQTLLLWADAREQSTYHGQLKSETRTYLLQSALDYLQMEKDDTAYHPDYGWSHAFAHGADLLAEAVIHPEFASEDFQCVFDTLELIFKNRPKRFLGDEELRLAAILIRPALAGKISLKRVINWFKNLELPLETDEDYDRWQSFRLFTLTIYVELDQANFLDRYDKEILYQWLKLQQ